MVDIIDLNRKQFEKVEINAQVRSHKGCFCKQLENHKIFPLGHEGDDVGGGCGHNAVPAPAQKYSEAAVASAGAASGARKNAQA